MKLYFIFFSDSAQIHSFSMRHETMQWKKKYFSFYSTIAHFSFYLDDDHDDDENQVVNEGRAI